MSQNKLSVYQRRVKAKESNFWQNLFSKVFNFNLYLVIIGFLLTYSNFTKDLFSLGLIYFALFFYYNLKYNGSQVRLVLVILALLAGYLIEFNHYNLSYLAVMLLVLIYQKRLKSLNQFNYSLVMGSLLFFFKSIFLVNNFERIFIFNLTVEVVVTSLVILLLLKLLPDISFFIDNKNKIISRATMLISAFSVLLLSDFADLLILTGFYNLNLARIIINYIIIFALLAVGSQVAITVAVLFGFLITGLEESLLFLPTNYAIVVIVANIFKEKGKLWIVGGYLLANILFLSVLNLEGLFIVLLLENAFATLAILLTPHKIIDAFRVFTKLNRSEELERRKLQNFVNYRIDRFVSVFQQLHNSFAEVSSTNQAEVNNVGTFLDIIVARVCQNCELYYSCWRDSFYTTYNSLFDLLALAENKGEILVDDLNNLMKANCSKEIRLTTTINKFVKMYELNGYWQSRLRNNESVLLEQLAGVSNIINDLAQELEVKVKAEKKLEKKLYFALKHNGIAVKKILVTNYNQQKFEFTLEKKSCKGSRECENKVLTEFKREFSDDFELIWSECGDQLDRPNCVCQYKKAKQYQFQVGVAAYSLDPNVSGDNYTAFKQLNDKFILILSDGMGVGTKANQESASAVNLLEKMLKADLDYRLALETINKILSLRSQDDKFATIDLLMVERTTGQAEFVKVGSAASFIKRGTDVELIKADSLPIGILSQVDYEKHSIQLKDNDLIIMLSDGILDSRRDIVLKEEWLIGILENNLLDEPKSLADYILEKAKNDNQLEDDMTVLVIKVNKC